MNLRVAPILPGPNPPKRGDLPVLTKRTILIFWPLPLFVHLSVVIDC